MTTVHTIDAEGLRLFHAALKLGPFRLQRLSELEACYNDLQSDIEEWLGEFPSSIAAFMREFRPYLPGPWGAYLYDGVDSDGDPLEPPGSYRLPLHTFVVVAISRVRAGCTKEGLLQVLSDWSARHRLNHVFLCPWYSFSEVRGIEHESYMNEQDEYAEVFRVSTLNHDSSNRGHTIPDLYCSYNRYPYEFMRFPSDPQGYVPEVELGLILYAHVFGYTRDSAPNPHLPSVASAIAKYIARSVLSTSGFIENPRAVRKRGDGRGPIPGEPDGLAINNLVTLKRAQAGGSEVTMHGRLRITNKELDILIARNESLESVTLL